MKKRVVITGMEILSSIGNSLETFWEAATAGKCGIERIQNYDPLPYPTQIAGEIKNFSLEKSPLSQFANPKRYPRVVQYALFCAYHAIARAGLSKTELRHAATYIGTSLGGTPELEAAYKIFFSQGWKKIPPLCVIRGMPNSIANHLAIEFGLNGPNLTISNACVSSVEAIGYAYQQIAQGQLQLALCGGTESLIWETIMAAWCKLRVMSTQNETPHLSCRPFSKNRSGFVMAEGAGILILEELDRAKARGATILAEIIGFGGSCDAYHVTVPKMEGQVRAIQAALDDAKLGRQDIQYINAHGTGTHLNDLVETNTIKSVFEEHAYNIPITAQKAMTGHAIGAAGVMEIIATVLSMQHNILLPTINLEQPDPDCDLDYVANHARKKEIDIALSNHFAFGGANAAIIIRRI